MLSNVCVQKIELFCNILQFSRQNARKMSEENCIANCPNGSRALKCGNYYLIWVGATRNWESLVKAWMGIFMLGHHWIKSNSSYNAENWQFQIYQLTVEELINAKFKMNIITVLSSGSRLITAIRIFEIWTICFIVGNSHFYGCNLIVCLHLLHNIKLVLAVLCGTR